MPKRIAALAVLLVLTLTGCAGVAEDAGDATPAAPATESAAPSVTQPATPSSAEAAPTQSVATSPAEETYLAVVMSDLAGEVTPITEQEALDAGHYACEQIAALPEGSTIIDRYNIQPIPGRTEGANSVIVREAIANLCP